MKTRLLVFLFLLLVFFPVLAEEEEIDDSVFNVTEYIDGDVNRDGHVSAADAAVVLRASQSKVMLEPEATIQADINADLKIDNTDAVSILLYSIKKTNNLLEYEKTCESSLLANKFLDRFSYHGITRLNDDYCSENVCVSVIQRRVEQTNVFIADVLIRSISSFRTAFGKNVFNGRDRTDIIAEENKAIIAINGDSCSQKKQPGPVIRNGKAYITTIDKQNDICALYYDGKMQTFSAGTEASVILAQGEVFQAWGFGPSLLDEEGKAKSFFVTSRNIESANPRTAIGYYEPGHYVFVVCDGRQKSSKGLTLAEFSKLFEELGCISAYNLDGGQTSVMANWSHVINKPYHNGRSTTDILYIGEPDSSMIMKEKQGE